MIRFACFALLSFLALTGSPAGAEVVLATVGEETITPDDVESEIVRLRAADRLSSTWFQRRNFYEPVRAPLPILAADRHASLDRVVRMLLFAQAAREDHPDEARAARETTERFEGLFQTWRTANEQLFPDPAAYTDEALAELREERTTLWFGRQIVCETEEDANVVLGRLMTGGDFGKLAKERSIDIGSRAAGGQMWPLRTGDWYTHMMDVIIDQQPGDLGGPLLTHFGYHIMHCDSILYDIESEEITPTERLRHLVKRAGVLDNLPAWLDEQVASLGIRLVDAGIEEAFEWMRPTGSTYLPPMPAPGYTPSDDPIIEIEGLDPITVADYFTYVGALSIDDWPRPENRHSVRSSAFRLGVAWALWEKHRAGAYPLTEARQATIRNAARNAEAEIYHAKRIEITEIALTDAEKVFTDHPDFFMVPETVSISAIGVASREDAEQIWAWLNAGTPFEAAALQARDLDPHAVHAPHTPFFPKGAFPESDDLVFSLSPGEFTKPVPVADGWQIYRLNQRRDPRPMRRIELTDDELRERARGILMHEAKNEHGEELRKRFEVEVNDKLVERHLGPV